MEIITTKVKKWGNSFGVLIPNKIAKKQNIEEGSEVEIAIQPLNKTTVRDIFGILKGKWKRSTQEILDEVDKELWPDVS